MNPERQFKKFLFLIIFIVAIIGFYMLSPTASLFFSGKKAFKISENMNWKKEIKEEENFDVPDIELDANTPEQDFSEEENKSFLDTNKIFKNEQKYWVSGNVPVNPMSNFNYKTKKEIYEQRKFYVEKSMFKNLRYVPSEEVFGLIEDNKPWISIDAISCYDGLSKKNKGLSEESRFINNPTLLLGVERISFDKKPKEQCSSIDYLVPVKISYSKDENMITVMYEISEYKGLLKNFVIKALNARDLGFKYGFIDVENNTAFVSPENITKNIYGFKDYIHLGMACGIKGGCNNGSPYQPELDFTITAFPASLHINLWKKYPKNKNQKPDINYLIIFR